MELLTLVLVPPLQLSVHPHAGRVTLVGHQPRIVFLPTRIALLGFVLDGDGSETLEEIFYGFSHFFVRPDVAFFIQRLASSLANLRSTCLKWDL